MSLKDELIKLGSENPDLREVLKVIISSIEDEIDERELEEEVETALITTPLELISIDAERMTVHPGYAVNVKTRGPQGKELAFRIELTESRKSDNEKYLISLSSVGDNFKEGGVRLDEEEVFDPGRSSGVIGEMIEKNIDELKR